MLVLESISWTPHTVVKA